MRMLARRRIRESAPVVALLICLLVSHDATQGLLSGDYVFMAFGQIPHQIQCHYIMYCIPVSSSFSRTITALLVTKLD